MTNNIPPEKLLPQDMVEVFDHGSPEEPLDPPVSIRMHASDAKHAMSVEPDRYLLESRAAALKPEPVKESTETETETGATGPAWYPQPVETPEPVKPAEIVEPVEVVEPVTDFGTESEGA